MTEGDILNTTIWGSSDQELAELTELVTCAEASAEALEAGAPDGAWALTAFGRHRVCELLGVTPYKRYAGDLTDDPSGLLNEAAALVDRLEVSTDGMSRRLALADALRSAANDIRMVADARDF
jgi:hypothetical protein